jgi:hypothetical protein
MFRIILIIGTLLVSGCVTVQPMSSDTADSLKKGKAAVAFFDGAERINYLEDKYYVLAVAKVGSSSTYKGFWNASKDLTTLHTSEMSRAGLQVASIYDVLSETELATYQSMQQDMYALYQRREQSNNSEGDPAGLVKPELRDALLKKGIDHLIWVTWQGYLLHIHTLGLSPHEQIATKYWIFNLKDNKLVWDATITSFEKIEIPGDSGKDFVEKNGLAGLKAEVAKLVKARYISRPGRGVYSQSFGQIIGIDR